MYLAGSIAVDLGLVLGLILYGRFAISTAVDDLSQYLKARESKDWSLVKGSITSSGTIPEGKGLGVVANYSYTIGGETFDGRRLMFSARRPVVASHEEADRMLVPFGRLREENEFSAIFDGIIAKPDRSVTVYYDPATPADSTLRKEYFANPDLGGLWPVVPISAFAIFILIWSIRSWRRYIANREYESPGQSRLPS